MAETQEVVAAKKTVQRRCKYCKGTFAAREADVKRGWAKFCSKSCKAKEQTRRTALSSQDDVRDRALEEAAQVADGFTCGGCGMDGKSGRAIRALKSKPTTEERRTKSVLPSELSAEEISAIMTAEIPEALRYKTADIPEERRTGDTQPLAPAANVTAGVVRTLQDGRLFIPLQAVMGWPEELRTWIQGASNYWRPIDGVMQGYILTAAPSTCDHGELPWGHSCAVCGFEKTPI